MTLLATDWLMLSLLLCLAAWFAGRLVAITLPLAVIIAALAIYLPTGSPRLTAPPKGEYTVLGADIQVDIAIYALLKPKGGPATYYRMPYSTSQANALQAAQDAAAGQQGGVTAIIGQDGGVQYDGPPPVTGEPPKQAEQPAVSIP